MNRDEYKVDVKTEVTDDYRVIQKIVIGESISARIANIANAQFDGAIRKALIDLGWTPPAAHKENTDGR